MHTRYSPCADSDMTVQAIVGRARRLHLAGLCLTDHFHPETDPDQFRRLRTEVEAARTSADPPIWVGCEVDVLSPGRCSIQPAQADLVDVVLAAPFHAIDDVDRPGTRSERDVAEFMMIMLHTAVDCPGARILAHPWWIWMEGLRDPRPVLKRMLDSRSMTELLTRAAKAGIAMELNPKVLVEPFRQAVKPFYLRCLDQKVRIATGSDAHGLDMMEVWEDFQAFAAELGADISASLWLPNEQLNVL